MLKNEPVSFFQFLFSRFKRRISPKSNMCTFSCSPPNSNYNVSKIPSFSASFSCPYCFHSLVSPLIFQHSRLDIVCPFCNRTSSLNPPSAPLVDDSGTIIFHKSSKSIICASHSEIGLTLS